MEPTETKDSNLDNLVQLKTSSTNLLGEILVEDERITEAQLLKGLKKHQEEGGFLGQTLIDLGFITQDVLTLVLIKQCKIPHINLLDYSIQADVAKIIPEQLCRKYTVVPIDKMGKILTVAMVDPLDGNVLHALNEVFPDLRIKPILCDWDQYQNAINKVFGSDGDPNHSPLELDLGMAGLPKKKAITQKTKATPAVEIDEEIPEATIVEPKPSDDISTVLSNAVTQMTDKFTSQLNDFMRRQTMELQSIARRMEQLDGQRNQPVTSTPADEKKAVLQAAEADLSPSGNTTTSTVYIPTNEMEARLQDSLTFSSNQAAHTFERFLAGKNNVLALNAAKETAQYPGQKFNPLFVFGPVGLGKTHLLNAIGQEILSERPDYRIAYGSATHFANQLIECKAANTTNAFFNAYTNVDVLILDDIQFLGGDVPAQEEFFHIFSELQNKNGQIILAGDKSPEKLGQLEQRLVSRFSSGMVVQLLPPEWDTRIAILKSHIAERGVTVPDESIAMLAMRISGDVRRLIGALIRVLSIAQLKQEPVTPELTDTVLIDLGFGEAA